MKTKVLLPVDRTRNSKTAEDYAVEFNRRLPLSVTLLNVINEKVLHDRGINPGLMDKLVQGQRDHAAKVLGEAVEPMRRAGVEAEVRIEFGIPGPTICRVAEEEKFDLVFITESGFSELGELLQGSVVSYVTRRCRVPVLVLRHRDR